MRFTHQLLPSYQRSRLGVVDARVLWRKTAQEVAHGIGGVKREEVLITQRKIVAFERQATPSAKRQPYNFEQDP